MIKTLIFAVILLTVGIPSYADVLDLRGRWQVIINASTFSAGGDSGSFMDVTAQKAHQFKGVGNFRTSADGTKGPLTFQGTINPNGVVNLHGMFGNENVFDAHGAARCTYPMCGGLWALRFAIYSPNQTLIDQGIIIGLQMAGGTDWNHQASDFGSAIDGAWRGFITYGDGDSSTFTALMSHVPNTTMNAGRGILAHEAEETSPDLIGTMSARSVNGTFDTEMLGITADGKVMILIGLLIPAVQNQPKMLNGEFRRWDSFFDVFTELVHGKNTSVGGRYSLRQ